MKIKEPYKRLSALWGEIDRQHNEYIAEQIEGSSVLDIGCGYGSLVNYLIKNDYNAVGIDSDPSFIEWGKRLFPQINLKVGNAESLDFPDQRFDAIILKDVMHHIYREGTPKKVFSEFRRVLKSQGRLIVFDPNLNFLLRCARRMVRHKDPECSLEEAVQVINAAGFSIIDMNYFESVGLALSGGYVGLQWVPKIPALYRAVVIKNRLLTQFVNKIGLGRSILWRYRITAVKIT